MSEVAAIVSYLRSRVSIQPEVAIVCGSGLSGLANLVEDAVTIEYTDIPHFPRSTVEGHGNVLVFGTLEGKKVVVMKGRFHFYEVGRVLPTPGVMRDHAQPPAAAQPRWHLRHAPCRATSRLMSPSACASSRRWA